MAIGLFLRQPLGHRLLPLYAAAFSHGFVLWYAIEKFFMHSIGFTDATIGLMASVYTVTVLLVETPSGILADRWSRRGVLLIASALLVVSTFIGGMSHSVPTYIIAMSLWGFFYAMYSGTYESIIYDTLLEERGSAKDFERWYGYVRFVDSVALALGAVLGGLLSSLTSPRMTFYATIPFAVAGLFALLRFREPKLHKAEPLVSVPKHIQQTFSIILTQRKLVPVLAVMLSAGLLLQAILEFNQLWWLSVAAPIGLYGVATALNLGSTGLGGLLASKLKLNNPITIGVLIAATLASVVVLMRWHNFYAVVAAQMTLVIVTVAYGVVFSKALHDELPSRLRAGSASAVSTFVSIFFIPFALSFGAISNRESPFSAAVLVFGIAVVLVIALIGSTLHRHLRQARLRDIVMTDLPK
jgi:MFS family permease